MTLESGIIFLLAIIIFAITPGPGVFALLSKAMVEGAQSCIPLALGMAVSDSVYLVLACYGLATIAENWGELFTIIRIVGAAYLIYLGWKMWHASGTLNKGQSKASFKTKSKVFIQGFLISASNPKVILFYIAFLPTFMDLTTLTQQDIAVAVVLCMVGLMIGLMAIAFSASWARNYFKSEKAMRGLNRVAGSIMATAGVYIGARS